MDEFLTKAKIGDLNHKIKLLESRLELHIEHSRFMEKVTVFTYLIGISTAALFFASIVWRR